MMKIYNISLHFFSEFIIFGKSISEAAMEHVSFLLDCDALKAYYTQLTAEKKDVASLMKKKLSEFFDEYLRGEEPKVR